jgi:hypothetical protein
LKHHRHRFVRAVVEDVRASQVEWTGARPASWRVRLQMARM